MYQPECNLVYQYDASGAIIGFTYHPYPGTASQYFFGKNAQGDVLCIYDTTGNTVARYNYDAWGACTIAYDNTSIGIANINPIRYRSYYYDAETGWYYLQSRYYDPAVGRFISPDDPSLLGANGDLLSYNLYAYCSNNPVNYSDPSGCLAISTVIIGCLTAFAIGSAVSTISQGIQYGWNEISVGQALIDGAFAAFSVYLAATGITFVSSVGVGAVMGFGQYAVGATFHNEAITLHGAIIATVFGGIGGGISGAGAKSLKTLTTIYDDMTGRAAQGVKALITAAQRYGFGSKQFALVNNLYGKAIQTAVAHGTTKAFVVGIIKIIGTTIVTPVLVQVAM